ncbi:MAG: winged helix-turn-helix transcriptional regulator [Promethearchaeota archaeon]
MSILDLVDKRIILELYANCRTSYQTLARRLGLTVNAIKKRLDKLIESGIIIRFCVYLSLAMLDAEMVLAILSNDGSLEGEEFLDKLGTNPMIHAASFLSDGSVLLFAEYQGASGLAELGRFLRQLEGVTDVEMHTLITEKGSKRDFSQMELKVLYCLTEDARMSIAEIARKTRLTPKRVRRIIQSFLGEGGSHPEFSIQRQSIGDFRTQQACLHFRLWWDLNAGGGLAFIVRIRWNEGGSFGEIVEWLKKEFPLEFWYAYASASEPIVFCVFVVEHMREADPIVQKAHAAPYVESANPIFGFPAKKYPGLRDLRLQELLEDITS